MAILKNEPLFSFKEGDYAKPHHIIVSGSDEEIGFDLVRPRVRRDHKRFPRRDLHRLPCLSAVDPGSRLCCDRAYQQRPRGRGLYSCCRCNGQGFYKTRTTY